MRKEYSQDAAYFSLPAQPGTPKFCIYLFVYSLVHNWCPCCSYQREGLHSAIDCTGLNTGLQGQMGVSSSRSGSVTSHLPHLLFVGRDTEDQDKESRDLLYHVCCGTGRSCPHSAAPPANLHWTLQTLELGHPPLWLGTVKGWVQRLLGTPQGARGRCVSSLPQSQASWTQLQPHEGVLPGTGLTQGREVTPQLINTPLVNLLCLCYGYRELMFPPHCMDVLRCRLGKIQNILDCHCILIADNLQIQARIWEKNEKPIGHLGWNDTLGHISNTCLVPT